MNVRAHAAGHDPQIADLIAAVDEGREPLVTGADARATLELVCAVYESAREGQPVTFPVHLHQPGLSAR